MIPVTTTLAELLATSQTFFIADLYTFNLANGTVLRYNSSDTDLSFGGNTWLGTALIMERGKIKTTIGVEVDQLQVIAYPRPSDVVSTDPFVQLAINGGLDGCYLQLDRAFSPGPGQAVTGIVPKRFYGRIAEVSGGRSKITITVKSDLDLLNIQMPRVLFQAPCSHSLYDAGCGLSVSAYRVSGTVSGSSLSPQSFGTTLTQADGYFALGVITFTSGANAGLRRYVRSYTGGRVLIVQPLGAVPADGDAFTIYPGCDKLSTTCQNKFGNLQNFRGFPYVPNPEVALL